MSLKEKIIQITSSHDIAEKVAKEIVKEYDLDERAVTGIAYDLSTLQSIHSGGVFSSFMKYIEKKYEGGEGY